MKRIIATILVVCALMCMTFAFASCDNTGNGDETTTTAKEEITTAAKTKITYKVKVVDENGNAVEGVYVQFCEDTENGRCFLPVTTDANGEAKMELEESTYKTVISMADGYTFSEEYTPFGNETTVTLTVSAQK